MANDEYLLERMRNVLKARGVGSEEKKMFGGVCFMVDNKMCFGTFRDGIMIRIAPEDAETFTEKPGVDLMYLGKNLMKGYLMLSGEAYDMDEDLEYWIGEALKFNPRAKASKKRKPKA